MHIIPIRLLLAMGLVGCGPNVERLAAPAPETLVRVSELRDRLKNHERIWLIVGHGRSHRGSFLDSLPGEEVVAFVAQDSVTPIWGPRHLAVIIERCGQSDTLLSSRGSRKVYKSAPCPWRLAGPARSVPTER